MNLIENKTIGCLTLKGDKEYPYWYPSLYEYNYESVKILFVSKFKIKENRLASLKENKGDWNVQVTDLHILSNNLYSRVSDNCNIYRNVFVILIKKGKKRNETEEENVR